MTRIYHHDHQKSLEEREEQKEVFTHGCRRQRDANDDLNSVRPPKVSPGWAI